MRAPATSPHSKGSTAYNTLRNPTHTGGNVTSPLPTTYLSCIPPTTLANLLTLPGLQTHIISHLSCKSPPPPLPALRTHPARVSFSCRDPPVGRPSSGVGTGWNRQ